MESIPVRHHDAWNKGKLVGQQARIKLKEIRASRGRVTTSRRRSCASHRLTCIHPSDVVETTSTSHQPASTSRHARSLDQASLRTDLRVPHRPLCKSQIAAL